MITSGKLTEIYNRWGDKNNLQPLGSADEELYRNDLKPNQYKWLIKFIKIWDITVSKEIQIEEIDKYGDVNQGLGTWNGYEYVKNK